jgi:hypothetical protein
MPTAYESALSVVAQKKHVLVHQFQFKKLEKSGGLQWWNVRNLKTGADQRISDNLRQYEKLRDILNNKLIWADTLEEQNEEEIEAEFIAHETNAIQRPKKRPLPSADASSAPLAPGNDESSESEGGDTADTVVAGKNKVAKSKPSKKINRVFNLCQQQSILSEVVFGNHQNKKGDKICPFQRSVHGNNGHFYDSVIAKLNEPEDGPFKDAPAVKVSVKAWIETAINLRKGHLEDKYGEQYMKRNDWDVYDYCESALGFRRDSRVLGF